MAAVVVRAAEGCADPGNLLWDTRWNAPGGVGDWQIADASETGNAGGLSAANAIETAVILALFTDKRVAEDHPLYFLADGDARGYWGDGVDVRDDLNEGPLGSHLWLLERAPLTIRGEPATRWATQFANEALATLAAQGVCARIEVSAEQNELQSRLELTVRLFARDGAIVFDRRFDNLWQQVAR